MRKLGDNRFDRWRIQHPMGEVPAALRDYAGAFCLSFKGATLRVIASRADDTENDPQFHWDHVSVSLAHRCPTWEEMCFIKETFFFANEVAMQLHPVAEYINNHPYCLHLWRPIRANIPLPPSILVGLPSLNVA